LANTFFFAFAEVKVMVILYILMRTQEIVQLGFFTA